MTSLDELLARPLFAVDSRVAIWADAIAAARAWGEWSATEAAAAAGLAATAATGAAEVEGAVTAHVTQWRRSRRLISADDTVAFLARWGVTEAQWLAHMRRQFTAERSTDVSRRDIDPVELARAAWIEGVVSGALELAAQKLAEAMAVWASVSGEGEPTLEALTVAAREHAAAVASPARAATLIESRWFEWTRLTLRQVAVSDEGSANELVYCVRDDARDLDEVAAAAGVAVVVADVAVGDLPASLAGALTSARPGVVIGPLADGSGYRVVVLDARAEPSPDDPATVARAREELMSRSVRAAVARHVRWLDPALVRA